MDTYQVLVLTGLLVMAAVSVVSFAWVFYLDGKLRNRPSPKTYEVHIEGTKVFTDEDIQAAREEARAGLHEVVVRSSELLRASLAGTLSGLSSKAEEMANIALTQEFEKYQVSFAALREETIKEFTDLQKQLDQRRSELLAQLEDSIARDREAHIDAFNARISDVVSGYLVEALDKGVDLGAQTKYILHTLEAHKEDIKKDVLS